MNFLFPGFLFALFTVAIPIIIHFFSFRRFKTVYFSNVNYLKNIKKESRKRSQLKQILMLVARILALISLVFAFSQPYIPTGKNQVIQPNPVVGIYIDNSFSMNAVSEKGQLIEATRNKAAEIAMAYNPGTKFRLLTNDLEPKHMHFFNREQFVQLITEVKISPNAMPLSRIIEKLVDNPDDPAKPAGGQFYLLSDFQRKTTDPENFKNDSANSFYFLTFTPKVANNLYIDTCWAEIPAHQLNHTEELKVKIVNRSGEEYQNLPLKLYINDSLKTLTNFNIASQGETVASLKFTNFKSGIQLGNIEITDYPFTHDNNYFLSYNVLPTISLLVLYSNDKSSSEGMEYLRALYRNDDYVVMDEENIRNLQISRLSRYNAIFLVNLPEIGSGMQAELVKAINEGCTVVVFPELQKNFESYNSFLSRINANRITGIDSTATEISGIDFASPVFREVFREKTQNALLPKISMSYVFSEITQVAETHLLWYRNSGKALSEMKYGKGKFCIFSFPLNKSTRAFAEDMLFVPTLYSLTLNSLPNQEIAYTIGKDRLITLQQGPGLNTGTGMTIKNPKTAIEFIPEVATTEGNRLRISLGDNIREAGQYILYSENKPAAAFSFNYDRAESDLRYYEPDELKRSVENSGLKHASVIENTDSRFTEVLDEIQHGIRLWKWFILAALFFLFAEAMISRYLK